MAAEVAPFALTCLRVGPKMAANWWWSFMAETPTSAAQVVRFGVFEVDLQAAELRKNGVKVKLQEQPFQILNLLLQRAGRVVTREELRAKHWPGDTFVDFEHGLNAAIQRLREALGAVVEMVGP